MEGEVVVLLEQVCFDLEGSSGKDEAIQTVVIHLLFDPLTGTMEIMIGRGAEQEDDEEGVVDVRKEWVADRNWIAVTMTRLFNCHQERDNERALLSDWESWTTS